MRVVTWNIWNIQGADTRWRRQVPEVLESCNADVILLQEVSHDRNGVPQSVALGQELEMVSERYFFAGNWQGREEGLAILSRYAMVRHFQHALSPGSDGMGRAICGATLATPHGLIDVYTTHLAFPKTDGAARLIQTGEAVAFIVGMSGQHRTRPVVLAGDLNDTPDSLPVKKLMAQSHLVDAYTGAEPPARWTFVAANPNVDVELGPDRCIDYLFYSQDWRLGDVDLIGRLPNGLYASDHLGISASLEIST